jgi:prepilin-type N-terminal cleavage/methylation domain-containing protein
MKRVCLFWIRRTSSRYASFTLIELLTVMAIISILAALTLYAGSAVMEKGRRSRAASEIQAMSTALEGYKTDNGIYPTAASLLTNTILDPYNALDYDGTSATPTNYVFSAEMLYTALSGQTNLGDNPLTAGKAYMQFKVTQLGNTPGTGAVPPASTYIKDPWGNSYGYSTGTGGGGPTTNYPYNGNNFFDLWTTAGLTKAKINSHPTLTNTWISNWQ